MNRDIPVQVSYDRTNKGVDVRNSSTANFLVDSQDRANYNASTVANIALVGPNTASADFQITKPGQNLITGFFTRIAMTEIVLTWNIFNISTSLGNNITGLSVRNTGSGVITNYNISIPQGNYTVKDALDALLVAINTATSLTFTLVDSTATAGGVAGKKAIQAPAGNQYAFYRQSAIPASPAPFIPNLSQSLGFVVYDFTALPLSAGNFGTAWTAYKPNLLAYNYIDITSPQLASQQKVKDSTTSTFDAIDVIYRWCFSNDEGDATGYDTYGYPVLQGYFPFVSKRYLSFPKQIRWDPLIPIGNLQFQTYTDQERLLSYEGVAEQFEFKMLFLVSEV